MQLNYALKFPFEDKNWLQKLLMLAAVGLVSLIPVLGLLAAALGLGFLVQLARNVRQGHPLPLPKWNDWQVKFEIGGQLLLAILLYHLPIVLLSMCLSSSISGLGIAILDEFFAYTFAFCCLVPTIILYTIIIWPLLAIGVAEFIETNEWQRFFRPFHQWEVLRNNLSFVTRWMLNMVLLNVAFGLLALIPCVGWIVNLMFAYPIMGHLLGQFAHQLSLSNKPQARVKARPRPTR
jgi:hypothetical protein